MERITLRSQGTVLRSHRFSCPEVCCEGEVGKGRKETETSRPAVSPPSPTCSGANNDNSNLVSPFSLKGKKELNQIIHMVPANSFDVFSTTTLQ